MSKIVTYTNHQEREEIFITTTDDEQNLIDYFRDMVDYDISDYWRFEQSEPIVIKPKLTARATICQVELEMETLPI